jgi:hypothetical protein
MWFRTALVFTAAVPIAGVAYFLLRGAPSPSDNPWSHVPQPAPHVDHAQLIAGPFDSGPVVTRACLKCHPSTALEVMQTSHWTWAGQKVKLPGHETLIHVGKANLINKFCIHAGPNNPPTPWGVPSAAFLPLPRSLPRVGRQG